MAPELRSIVGESPKVTLVASGFAAASGPVFSRRGYLLFCEAGKILKWQDSSVSVFRDAARGERALTFDHQGRLLACEKDQLTRTEKDGAITVVASKLHAPSDVVYAIDGNIYFCGGGSLYRTKGEAAAQVAARGLQRAAGVALAPNQQMLYATNAGNNVRVFSIRPDGALDSGRIFSAASGILGPLKTDENGRVWAATSAGIEVFERGGKSLGTLAVPEPPTGLCWAEGFRNLIVSSKSSLFRVEARVNGTRTY